MLSVQMIVFFCETYGLSKIDYFHTIAHLQKFYLIFIAADG